ncbi:hypothetical protein RhiirA4_490303 [Rhizophagus irregularis]|uniref:Uncharacterized protein n=1 Tax=Rhizophagus irregularis TaxID=588596 RepID=A0A2I1HVI6_9GLOM|nr:hypothetical protein RhiirA4_490303 [Rhizophagus irregularis]
MSFFYRFKCFSSGLLWNRKVWGIKNTKCPRCMIEEETWDHIWVCAKNDVNNSEYVLFKESMSEMIASVMVMDKDENRVKEFERNLLEIAVQKSKLMTTENLLREVTRGIINDKWMNICTSNVEKNILREIFDNYLKKLQSNIWVVRCNETVEIEKQMGIFKDLKRKKREDEIDEIIEGRSLENIENGNNRKKIKKIIKINLEENVKNDVFIFGKSDRNSLGNRIISNLINT